MMMHMTVCFKVLKHFTFENECLYVTDPDWGQHWHRVGGEEMFSVHSPLDLLRNDGLFQTLSR